MNTPSLAQQRDFFETFGFLKLPGLLSAEIAAITAEFEAVFPQLGRRHDGTKQTSIAPFVDHRPALCALLDHPAIVAAAGNLLGPDFNYVGSDGNYFTGRTTWHRDTELPSNAFIKVAFYLDAVGPENGCLRVMPGSHLKDSLREWREETMRDAENRWGQPQDALPSVPLTSNPGDVLMFNHRLMHASFGGSQARRMFTLNLSRRARTPVEIDDLVSYADTHGGDHNRPSPYGPVMLETANAARQVHLEQFQRFWPAGIARRKARAA